MKVLITGGMGFVGGHVADLYTSAGHEVTVVDACLPETGGAEELWAGTSHHAVIRARVEDVENLPSLVRKADLIVDAMGWTRHMLALKDPENDLALNLSSHLCLIKSLPKDKQKKVIFLGSRGQYGNPKVEVIDESTPQVPEDVQGIHKVAAESHWRQISRRFGHSVVSLRFGNSYGPHQPMEGSDIGLLGGFIRIISADENVELYGRGRSRPFIYVADVARAVVACGEHSFEGFTAFNLASEDVPLESALDLLVKMLGKGGYSVVEFPQEEKTMDVGNAQFSGEKFTKMFPDFETTLFAKGLADTLSFITK